jgi:5-methylcytosine-specific restriction endonuclease McrA
MVWRKYPAYKKNPNTIKKLDNLSVKDLKKILRSIKKYEERIDDDYKCNTEIERIRNNNELEWDRWYKKHIDKRDTYRNRKTELWNTLYSYRVKGLLSFLTPSTFYNGENFESDEYVDTLIEKHKAVLVQIKEHEEIYQRNLTNLRKANGKLRDKKYRDPSLLINDVRRRLEIGRFSSSEVQTEIDRKIQDEKNQKEEVNTLRARIVEKDKSARKLAKKYRNFDHQIKKLRVCPYCGDNLYESHSHLDHIYPLSKGGLSNKSNLVFICQTCNQNKSNLTLRNFIKKMKFDESVVYDRLEKLGKDF